MPVRLNAPNICLYVSSRSAKSLAAATLAMIAMHGDLLAQAPYGQNQGMASNYSGAQLRPSVNHFPASGDLPASPWAKQDSVQPASAKASERTQPIPPPSQRSAPASPPATIHWGAIHALPVQANATNASGRTNSLGSGTQPQPTSPLPENAAKQVTTRVVSSPTELSLGPTFETAPSLQGLADTPSIRSAETLDLGPEPFELQPMGNAHPSWGAPTSAPDPRWIAEQERLAERMELAQRVSDSILSGAPAKPNYTPRPLERPVGWNSIEQELKTHMEKCEQLLRRGAVHSAREEVATALRKLVRAMDANTGTAKCEPTLEMAFTALREEAEFHRVGGRTTVHNLVSTHSTPALKGNRLDGVTAEVASQHYRQYARTQFVRAAEQHPWAADLLYAYGKTLEKEADGNIDSSIRLRSQAVICYQAALEIRQGHPAASAQLGYTLMSLDRLEEAQQVLSMAVQASPSGANWSNLAEVYRRRGAMRQADYAVAQASAMSRSSTATPFSRDNPEVTHIDAAEFARYSPAQNMVAPSATSVPQTAAPAKTASLIPSFLR